MLNSKNKKLSWLSYLMVMLLIANIFTPYDSSYAAGTDKTEFIKNILQTDVFQGGKLITETEGKIDVTKPFELKGNFAFNINREAEDVEGTIKLGDTATIHMTKGVQLSAEQLSPRTLVDKKWGKSVATLTFRNDAEKNLYADIVFEGEAFSKNEGFVEAGISFEASMSLDKDSSDNSQEGQTIIILNKTFHLQPPPTAFKYEFNKNGVRNGNIISWTVTVKALKNDKPHSLRDHIFSDDLKDVGELVSGTFKINGAPVADPAETKLEHTFATDDSEATITFDTKIPDSVYFAKEWAEKGKDIINTAQLSGTGDGSVPKVSAKIHFKPVWIEKTGKSGEGSSGVYDSDKYTITWTITANQEKAILKNAYIEDNLSTTEGKSNFGGQNLGALTLDNTKVTLRVRNKDDKDWGPEIKLKESSSGPRIEGNKFYLTGEDQFTEPAQYLLEFTTKVPKPPKDFVASKVDYYNKASIHWEDGPGIKTGEVKATVGFNVISKKHINTDSAKGIVTWDATVEAKGQDIPQLAVYEVFSYSNAGLDGAQISTLPAGIIGDGNLTKGQRYIEDSFAPQGSPELKYETGKIKNGENVEIGQWIKITGFQKDKPATYRLQTQVVAPELQTWNAKEKIVNKAVLYSDAEMINRACASTHMKFRVRYKDLLHRKSVSDPVANKNDQAEEPEVGFDYKEKTVIYRLSFNADGIDFGTRQYFDKTEFKTYGEVVYEDMLPLGWEFVPIDGDKKYVFFDAEPWENDEKALNRATTKLDTPPIEPIFVEGTDTTRAKAIFTFPKDKPLNKPYVVLVKAKPTSKMMKEYFEKETNVKPINTLTFKITDVPGIINQGDQAVQVRNTILKKDLDSSKAREGILTWTIDYTPSELTQKGFDLTDKFSEGFELPIGSDGNLLPKEEWKDQWADLIKIQKLELQKDGKYTAGEVVPVKLDGTDANVKYDSENRVLTFNIKEGKQAYRFTYKTVIVGKVGDKLTNEVKLSAGDLNADATAKPFVVTYIDAKAFARLGGYVNITKVDGTTLGNLEGAEFKLTNSAGKVLRTGTTDKNGNLKFIGLPAGTYTLSEIKAPGGYKADPALTFKIEVKKGSSDYTTKIFDNKNKKDISGHDIKVQNFLADTGQLMVTKAISGTATGKQKNFNYTFNFSEGSKYPLFHYDINGKATEKEVYNKQTLSLGVGEKFVIDNLKPGMTVTVTEAPATDYKVTSVKSTQIEVEKDKTKDPVVKELSGKGIETQKVNIVRGTNQLDYTNTYTKGGVKVTKKVTGSAADPNKEFVFTVHFSKGLEYDYVGENGLKDGKIKSGKTISLKHGQSFVINDIPAGTMVGITEDPQDYTLISPTNKKQNVKINAGEIEQIEYVNNKEGAGGIGGPGTPGGTPPSSGGGNPQSPVRPPSGGDNTTPPSGTNPPETITDNTTPLGSNTTSTKPDSTTQISDSTIIGDESVPKQGIEKAQKIAGAPKTGFSDMNIMFKNFLTYGTLLLLLLALIDEYSKKSYR